MDILLLLPLPLALTLALTVVFGPWEYSRGSYLVSDTCGAGLEERLKANLAAMDPETLIKTWMPASVQGFEQLQKMFWSHLGRDDGKED